MFFGNNKAPSAGYAEFRDACSRVIKVDINAYICTTHELPRLEERYKEPWRQTQRIDHINTGLCTLFKELPSIHSTERKMALVRAWLYRDAFFVPELSNYECAKKSALLAAHHAPKLFPEHLVPVVTEHIYSLGSRSVAVIAQFPTDTALLLDIDNVRFAGTWDEFCTGHRLRLAELAHIPREMAIEAQKQRITALLKQDRIFHTPTFYVHEAQARKNLLALHKELE
jgi:predicted metal-dependent HD superfamily phosphohydrolase